MADSTIVLSTSGWTQDRKTMAAAMAVKVMADAGISCAGVRASWSGDTGTLTIVSPTSDPTVVISVASVDSAYSAWQTASDAAKAAYNAEVASIDAAVASSPLKNVTLATALSYIDAIANLADAKVFLKRLTTVVYAVLRKFGTTRP